MPRRYHRLALSSFALAVVMLVASAPIRRAAAEEGRGLGLSPADFAKLFRELDLKAQPWTGIPWKVSVTEARREAARQRKPIFLVVNTGNCLGFV